MDWVSVAGLGTAAGTLVLAIATFASVRSANRAARTAERALAAGLRPLLIGSRLDDPAQKIHFSDRHLVVVKGGSGVAECTDAAVYLAMSLRNAGAGVAILHGWFPHPSGDVSKMPPPPAPEDFRRLTRDIYIAAGDAGFWQGALRDPESDEYAMVRKAIEERTNITIDVLYGDHEGGQRVISRFGLIPIGDEQWTASPARHWNVDRPDPR